MNQRFVAFGALKMRQALDQICSSATLQEGLYNAYVEGLQWIDEIGEFSADVQVAFGELEGALTQVPGPDRISSVRATISGLSTQDCAALARRLIDLAAAIHLAAVIHRLADEKSH